jgi:hypothetical protein
LHDEIKLPRDQNGFALLRAREKRTEDERDPTRNGQRRERGMDIRSHHSGERVDIAVTRKEEKKVDKSKERRV